MQVPGDRHPRTTASGRPGPRHARLPVYCQIRWPQEMVEIEQCVKVACAASGVYFHPFTGYASADDMPSWCCTPER